MIPVIQNVIKDGTSTVPLFVLPGTFSSLLWCIFEFLIVVAAIVMFERIWNRGDNTAARRVRFHRILVWEFATVASLILMYVFQQYCVVLPLLFLLAFLSMWYLVSIVREW